MMSVDQVRMPDLWLKRALAFALLDEGEKTFWLVGDTLIKAVRGSTGTVFSLNKMIAGDTKVGVGTDLYYFAALFEYLLVEGPEAKFDHATIAAFAAARPTLALYPKPILGTFSDFAGGLLVLMSKQPGWSPEKDDRARKALARVLRQALKDALDDASHPAEKLHILWGKQRNWALSADGLERIIHQPVNEIPPIPEGDFVQIVAPGAPSAQWLFGFELRADDGAVTDPWGAVGSWFALRNQPAETAIALLPEFAEEERNATVAGPGNFWIQVIGVEAPVGINIPPALPPELAKLIAHSPVDWPAGYAEAIASVTYVSRQHDWRRKEEGRQERRRAYLEPMAGDDGPLPAKARLYRGEYRVVAAGDGA